MTITTVNNSASQGSAEQTTHSNRLLADTSVDASKSLPSVAESRDDLRQSLMRRAVGVEVGSGATPPEGERNGSGVSVAAERDTVDGAVERQGDRGAASTATPSPQRTIQRAEKARLQASAEEQARRINEVQLELEAEKGIARQKDLAEQRAGIGATDGNEFVASSSGFMADAKGFMLGVGKLCRVVGTGVASFTKAVITDRSAALEQIKNTAASVGHGVSVAASFGVMGAKKVGSFLLDVGMAAAEHVTDFVTGPVRGVCHFARAVGEGLLDSASALVGRTSWSDVQNRFAHNLANSTEAFLVAGNAASAIAGGVWRVAKGLSDSIGLSDLLGGVAHTVAVVPHLLVDIGRIASGTGSFTELKSNAASHLSGMLNGVVGAGKCFVEVTGIADLYRMGYHAIQAVIAYGRGDTLGVATHCSYAVMHGAFVAMSWGAIVATVGSGGVAAGTIGAVALGRQSLLQGVKTIGKVAATGLLKTAEKQFVQALGGQLAEGSLYHVAASCAEALAKRDGGSTILRQFEHQAREMLGSQGTPEAVQQFIAQRAYDYETSQLAARGAEHVLTELSKRGPDSLVPEGVVAISRTLTEGVHDTRGFLRAHGLHTFLESEVFTSLKELSKRSPKDLASRLASDLGLNKAEAESAAKNFHKAIKSGQSDTEIKEILEDAVVKRHVSAMERSMEEPFMTTLERGFKGELPELFSKEMTQRLTAKAAQAGKSVGMYSDELIEAGWKGYREGYIEGATKKVVREGIEAGFRKFRGFRRPHTSSGAVSTRGPKGAQFDETLGLDAEGLGAEGAEALSAKAQEFNGERVAQKRFIQREGDSLVHYVEIYDPSNNATITTVETVEKVA